MKVTVEYDLDDYDKNDKMKLEMAMQSENMYWALREFGYNTRKTIEWELDNKELTDYDVLDLVFEKFGEILEYRYIDLSKW
jgi:hypothetical protein